ncbi:MAG: iron-siderophore ABC transporter substrate-binding protein, partial [Solibacillus isronensis]
MKTKKFYSLMAMLFVAMGLLVVAGCSDKETSTDEKNSNETTGSSNSEDSATQYPIVIKHALGETVIEEKPERVASVAWANHDVALALGVVPVGFSAANYGVQDESG